jgi:hypothetical protein
MSATANPRARSLFVLLATLCAAVAPTAAAQGAPKAHFVGSKASRALPCRGLQRMEADAHGERRP